MKFSCSQKNLTEALITAQKAVPSLTPHPVLEGIYIETQLDVLKMRATDTNITIETYLDANVQNPGSVIVPSRMFTDLVRKLPDTTLNITVTDNRVRIEYYNSVVHINSIPGVYPELKEEITRNVMEFSQEDFKKMIQKTVFAAAVTDHLRPDFTGQLLSFKENRLTMVCLDGFRLALAREKIRTSAVLDEEVIVPAKSMTELSKILGHTQDSMDIKIGSSHIVFDLGKIRLTSTLIAGKFIDYTQVVNDKYKIHTKIDKELLFKSLDRATVFARDDKNNLVEFVLKEDKLMLSSNSEFGDIHDEVPMILSGEEMKISFNSRYYMEALRVIEDDEIRIDFINSLAPCLIRSLSDDHYAYMILPVRTSS